MGKALNNPAEGLKRLERNFGDLGKETEAAIKLQQDMGNQSGALAIAIEALQKKIGGADETMNAGLTGSVKQLRKAISELMEAMGSVADNSVVTGLIDGVSASLRGLKEVIDGPWALKLAAILALMQGRGIDELMRLGNMAPGAVTPSGSGGGGSFSLADQDERALKALEENLRKRAELAKRAAEEESRARYEAAKAELDAEEMFARDYAEAWKWADHYRTEEEKKESKLRQEIAQAEMDAREMALDDFIGAWKAYDEFVRKQDKQRLDEAQQQYGGFINGIESAFRDGWNHIGESWKDALGVMKNAFKRILLDFIYQSLAKPFVLNLLVSLGNATGLGGLTTAATAAGGGGGIGSIISGMGALMPSGAIGTAFSNVAQMVSGALGLSGSVGSMIGSVASFLPGIGTAIAVASMLYQAFNDGPENPNLRIFQGQGGSGLFGGIRTEGNYSWDNTGINAYIGGLDARLARILGPAGTAAATAGLSAYTQAGLRSDGQPAQFAFPEGDATAAEQLAREVLQSRYGIIFQQIDSTIAETIRTWSGTSTELQAYIETALGIVEGLGEMGVTGLNITTLQLMTREGETLAQTFQRVAGTWSWFNENFYTESERLEMATTQVNGVFAQLGLEIPGSVTEFRKLVEGLDLSTEEGRRMWDMLMGVAPAFLTVTNAADDATTATEDLSDALLRQAEIQRQIEESVRNSRESQLAAIVGARGGLANFLNGTALGGLSPMTPQEKLAEAKRQYEAILAAAMGGDLGAAGRLGGAAETYLQIAREMFASGSGYISIYDQVMGQVKGVDQRLAIDEQILRATLGMATDIAAQTEILIEVKSLLIDIRDKGPAVVAGDTKPR